MAEKCRKAKGAQIERCDAMQYAISNSFVQLQHMRDMETGKTRQQISLVKPKEYAPFLFCPWCRANIDTRPIERSPKNSD